MGHEKLSNRTGIPRQKLPIGPSGHAVVGGLDDRGIVVDGTPEEIRSEVKDVISGFGEKGLILGADCTFPTDINVANIRAAVEATSS